jgi:hypothetical protein
LQKAYPAIRLVRERIFHYSYYLQETAHPPLLRITSFPRV